MESISQKDYYKAALESFHRNLITVFKKNGGMKDAVSVLKSFDPEMTGIYSLGDIDNTDRSYLNFLRLLSDYGISYVEARVSTDGSPNESAYIIYNIDDQYMVEELRLIALEQARNYRLTLDSKEAENRIASSTVIKDKNLMTITGLNFYEKELLLERCKDISPGYLIHEEETLDEDGTVKYNLSVRDSRVLAGDKYEKDICKVYLYSMVSLYGYNGNKIIDHFNADLLVKEMIDLSVRNGNTVYVAGANEERIKHYIEINPSGFSAYLSVIRDGKRYDAYMQPESIFKCRREAPEYEEKLLSALGRIPSKTVLTTAKELSTHLNSRTRSIDSAQPTVGRDEYIAATREKELVDIIDEAIRDRFFPVEQQGISGQDKFELYKDEAINILNSCINGTVPQGYDPSVVLSINAILDEAGIDKSNYIEVAEALGMHEAYTHEAQYHEIENDRDEIR